MLRKPSFVALFVTAYLLVYVLLLNLGAGDSIIFPMFIISPALIVWLMVVILQDRNFKYPNLEKEEEWGYQDKDKNSLGMF